MFIEILIPNAIKIGNLRLYIKWNQTKNYIIVKIYFKYELKNNVELNIDISGKIKQ